MLALCGGSRVVLVALTVMVAVSLGLLPAVQEQGLLPGCVLLTGINSGGSG